MNRRLVYLVCGIPLGIFCFLYMTLLFVPNDAIKGLLVRLADSRGYTLEVTGLRKSLLLGVKATEVELSSAKGPLLRLRDTRVGLEVLPLTLGKLRVSVDGMIGTGSVEGEVGIGKTSGWELHLKGVRLEEIPFFANVAGARIKGDLQVNGALASGKAGKTGDVQLQVRGAELASLKIGEMPLPDANYKEIRGALRIEGGRALLKSFTLEGDDVYMRLKGDVALSEPIGNSPLNLTLEMMPKQAFLDRQKFVFLLLMKYQTSPGAFSMPIHGSLAHPSL